MVRSERITRMSRRSVTPAPFSALSLFLIALMGVFNAGAQITINYNFNDGQLPPGTAVSGVATIGATDGILHLTDDLQASANGNFFIPDPAGGRRVGNLHVHWKRLIGGSTTGAAQFNRVGADGYSLSWGADVQGGSAGEEGVGTGLSVTIDTFDNGGGEAPGIEIKWGGPDHGSAVGAARIAFDGIDPDQGLAKDFLRKNQFVDADLTVDNNTAIATFTYDGRTISAPLNGYAGIAGGNFVFGARTGGAWDNQWIDDVSITEGITELQTVQLLSFTNTVWKYLANTNDPGYATADAWTAPAHDDSTWLSGTGLFGYESTASEYDAFGLFHTYIAPPNGVAVGLPIFPGQPDSPLSPGPSGAGSGGPSAYFRTHFTWTGNPAGVTLNFRNAADDGFIVYLNGVELYSFDMPDIPRPMTWDINTLPGGANPLGEAVPIVTNLIPSTLIEGDNVVAVELHQQGPGSSDDVLGVQLTAILPLPPTITDASQPSNRVVFAHRSTTLSVYAIGSPAPSYQWVKDGVPIDPAINPTAITPNYVISDMMPEDAGTYVARISNPLGSVDSRAAVVTYVNDITPPTVIGAVGSATFDKLTVLFSEKLDPQTASDSFNYALDGGLSVISVALNPDGASVTLTTDPQTPDTVYTVTVTTVAYLAGSPIAGNNTAQVHTWAPGPCNIGLLFEVYRPLSTSDNSINNTLLRDPDFPNNPQETLSLPGFDTRLAYSDDSHEGYGARIRGLFIPPVSGDWIFYLRSDDSSRLYLNSSGPDAAGKVLVQEETGCCGTFSGHRTAPISLTAGQGYYIEAIYKEGTGGDFCQVAAKLAVDPTDPNTLTPIPGGLVGAGAAPPGIGGPINITTQPADANVLANVIVSFSVAASNPNSLPICYQWRRDGADIAGANGPSYSFGPVSVADSGAHFDCVVAVIGSSTVTRSALLTVGQDTTPPTCVSASAAFSLSNVFVRFSEFVDPGTAGDSFNYSVSGFSVVRATLNPDQSSVTVTLDGRLNIGATYQISVQNVTDLAGNTINPNPCVSTFKTPVISCGFALQQLYLNIGDGVAISDLTGNSKFPDAADSVSYVGLLEGPVNFAASYGTRLSGWLFPPVSGNYNFFMSSDDNGEFWLSTDDSPANAVLICSEPQWAGSREWTGDAGGRRTTAAPENQSSTLFPGGIPLVAGQKYFFQLLAKEGGGGDNCAVAWQLPGGPVPVNGSSPISGAFMGSLGGPPGAQLAITQQPTDVTFVSSPSTILDETFNANDGGFTVTTPLPYDNSGAGDGPWMYDAATGSWMEDGEGPEDSHPNTSILTSPTLTITKSGALKLTLVHRYSFEFDGTRWDGGQVQLSVNGSEFVAVPDAAWVQNGYGGNTVAGNSASVLAGKPAFTAESSGYDAGFITSIAAGGNYNAGDTIVIRFYAASDTNTRGKVPNWQIDHVTLDQGQSGPQNVTFSTAVSASNPGTTNPPIFYQWYRDDGSGFTAILGANSATYSFLPACGDNGARFRVQVYTPGAVVTSDAATLTVAAPNTAPSFALTPPPAADANSGVQTVANVAHDIVPGSATIAVAIPSIGLNFGADEVNSNNGKPTALGPLDKAGVVPQANWNNLNGASGSASGLAADYVGTPIGTTVAVTWSCPNTWSTTGRGEDNNGFPAGPDRTLMTGYLDTTDQPAGAVTVTVSGLGPEFTAGGYDVIVYALGGTSANRYGAYSIGTVTQVVNSAANPTGFVLDPGVNNTDSGDYAVFHGQPDS